MQNIKIPSYREPSLLSLVLLTFLGAMGCMLLGYIVLPFAAAFYAALIFTEKKSKFLFSYLIPIFSVAINFLLNGPYSLEGVSFAAVGFLIYYLYGKNKSKNETVFWVALLILLLFVLSGFFLAFRETDTFKMSAVVDFYGKIYNTQKANFTTLLLGMATKNEAGITTYLFNPSDAELYFIEAVKMLIPLIPVIAFLLCGLSMKIFSRKIFQFREEQVKISNWKFCPPTIIAYFFLIVSILTIFVSDGIFAEALVWIDFIFSFVFAYMGIKFINMLSKQAHGGRIVLMIFILMLFLSTSFAIGLLTYFGAFFAISTSKRTSGEKML